MAASIKYEKHSIGQHIVKFDLVFRKNTKASEALEKIRNNPKAWTDVEHLFVVDSDNKLSGTVEFETLLASRGDTALENLVTENYPYVSVHSHQSNVARIALKRGAENIPVVDEENHFVGIIDATQILKILHEEHVEKLMHFTGILNNESLLEGYKANIKHVVRSRLPWLFLGLTGGILSTFIIRSFTSTLETELALAFFIPVIVYMNAAVGNQAQIIFVRYSSLERVDLLKSILFELKVAFYVAVALSTSIYIFISFWLGLRVATVVFFSMFLGILSSAFIGTIIPWLLEKYGKDPAIGSGPFTTIVQDLLSIFIYFSIAAAIL